MNNPVDHRPRVWVAILFGIFSSCFALLYAGRPKWFAFYLVAFLATYSIDFFLLPSFHGQPGYLLSTYLVLLLCIVHAGVLASRYDRPTRPYYSRWYGTLGCIAVFSVALLLFRAFLYEPFSIKSAAMVPTYRSGTQVVVSKIGFDNHRSFGIEIHKSGNPVHDLERGEVIVFQYPRKPEITFLKRVIGLPGDEIEYTSGRLEINGEAVRTVAVPNSNNYRETIGQRSYLVHNDPSRDLPSFSVEVPENAYFVLGDNRTNSADSRHWGFVPASEVIGRVVFSVQGPDG